MYQHFVCYYLYLLFTLEYLIIIKLKIRCFFFSVAVNLSCSLSTTNNGGKLKILKVHLNSFSWEGREINVSRRRRTILSLALSLHNHQWILLRATSKLEIKSWLLLSAQALQEVNLFLLSEFTITCIVLQLIRFK